MTQPPIQPYAADSDDEIGAIDLLVVLAKSKRLILGLPILVVLVVAGLSLLIPNVYTASTRILPPQQNQSTASAMLAQLGGLGGLLGGGAAIKNSNDLYVAMLKSRTVADSIIQRFGLIKLWEIDPKHPSDAHKALEGVSSIASGKDGLITIEVDDADPKRAAELANAYVDELFKFTSVIAVTEASQRRLFFERQFGLAKDNLAKAESAARQALQSGGLVKVDEQGRAMVETSARLRGQITVKEVQIGAMRTFAADRNPDLQLALQELESLKRELAKIEGAGSATTAQGARLSQGLGNISLLRDVKYYEVIFELLAKQYEMAKIDEAKDSAIIQVIDKAVEPDRKSKPKRSLIVALSALIGVLFAFMWVIVKEAWIRAKRNPERARQMQELRSNLAIK